MVNVGKYAIHGSYGICNCSITLIIFPMAFQFPTFPIQWPYMTSVPCAFKEIMHILSQRVDIFQKNLRHSPAFLWMDQIIKWWTKYDQINDMVVGNSTGSLDTKQAGREGEQPPKTAQRLMLSFNMFQKKWKLTHQGNQEIWEHIMFIRGSESCMMISINQWIHK